MDVDALYQEIILDHYKHPHGRGLRDPYEAEVHHVNPTCGDEITLRVHLDGDRVADVSYAAEGCSISQASASVLNDLVIGRTVDDAMALLDDFTELMQGRGKVEPERGPPRGRHRLRRRRPVPGPHQVRPALVDGLERRHRASPDRSLDLRPRGERMTTTTATCLTSTSRLPPRRPAPPPTTTSSRR